MTEKLKQAGDFLKKNALTIAAAFGVAFMGFMALISYKFSIGRVLADPTLTPVRRFYFAVAGACLIYLALIWFLLFVKKLGISIERIAVCSVAFFGLVFMLVLPPFSAPDEDTTYVSCYAVSNAILGKEIANEEDFVYMRREDVNALMHRHSGQNDYLNMLTHLLDRSENNEMVLCSMQKQNTIFWAFLPQAVGLTIARLLGMGQIPMLMLGRLVNFLLYLLLFGLAIKRMPFGKHILFVISMFPMVLEQISSMSYDALVLGLSFYFIAIVFDLIYKKEEVTVRDIILMIAVMAVLAPLKVIYVMLTFLCLLIPKKKFITAKRYRTAVICMAAAACATILFAQADRFSQYIRGTNNTLIYSTDSEDKLIEYEVAVNTGVIATEETELFTFSIVLHNLPRMVAIWGNSVRVFTTTYLEQMFGKYLGWLEIEIPTAVIYGFFALFLSLCIRERHVPYQPTSRQKAVYLAVFGIVAFLAYLFMLVGHTTNGAEYCMGVQGRYFLPALPLIPVLFWNRKLERITEPVHAEAPRRSGAEEAAPRLPSNDGGGVTAYERFTIWLMGGLLMWTVISVFDIVANRIGTNI